MVLYYGKNTMCQAYEIIIRCNCTGKLKQSQWSALQHIMTLLFNYPAHSKKYIASLWYKMHSFYRNKIVIFLIKQLGITFKNI